jgi:hypothetical protein
MNLHLFSATEDSIPIARSGVDPSAQANTATSNSRVSEAGELMHFVGSGWRSAVAGVGGPRW